VSDSPSHEEEAQQARDGTPNTPSARADAPADAPAHAGPAAGGVRRAGARWIKTSTGFGPGGATVEAVTRLREAAGGTLRIKAAGGIRSRDDAERLLAAGADRLGSSRSVLIVATEERDA